MRFGAVKCGHLTEKGTALRPQAERFCFPCTGPVSPSPTPTFYDVSNITAPLPGSLNETQLVWIIQGQV